MLKRALISLLRQLQNTIYFFAGIIVDHIQNLSEFDPNDNQWSPFMSPALGTPMSRRYIYTVCV